jgi:hypothetical protein
MLVRQYGLISREQALDAGLSDSSIWVRLNAGAWEAILPGVYRLVGVPGSWFQTLKAAELWAGRGAALSHRCAAAHWGLDGNPPGPLEITVPFKTTAPEKRLIVHVSSRFSPRDVVQHHGIATTTLERTLIDLGAVQRRWRVQVALDHALRSRLTSPSELWSELERAGGRGRRGAGVLRSLLEETAHERSPSGSPLERKMRSVIKRYPGIPEPQTHYLLFDVDGLIGELDFAWPDIRLGLETDGFDPHMTRESFHTDRVKMNRAAAIGWTVLRGTWEDATNPSSLMRTMQSFFP